MSSEDLATKYNSKETEVKWYSYWESQGYFHPKSDTEGKRFRDSRYVIVIPPPNVTGILHMGHALNNSIQDILIRWNRMKGNDTLWVPGVDHAGIATQNVVERKLAKEKKTRYDLGREAFLQEVWKWKEEHGNTITRQLRRLGASCDWSRERFTMDEGLSRAVREAFVTLYERGLIYQGHYIINWCPRCQTALSDEEAAHKEVEGGLYHIKYPIAGKGRQVRQTEVGQAEKVGEDHVVLATTRPETMLGDTAVAVHPRDPRYRHLVGKKVILPLMEREIPVIEDEFVDPEFGTGVVKVTPAHDPNDFVMGQRHQLAQINILNPDGTINQNGGAYVGLDRFEARKRVVEDLKARGLFIRRDSHLHAVGHCYRCNTMIEPYLSKQWFVRMRPLAEKALAAYYQGKTKFYPDRWTKVYLNWLEGIRDWCISRQIWWGHQIPVWYCDPCLEISSDKKKQGIIAARETPAQCPDCGNKNLRQDPDVLDTWFSSWLWPFSTLGWPDATDDLKYFYPTSDLVTAPEIIFFWVARMIMAGLEFLQEVPFRRVYIHGTVRAQSGFKMSKSLGNAIDPLEVIEEMGADALRFSMIMLSAQDVYLSREKFEVGRNFTNKIWNASRFVLMNLKDFSGGRLDLDLDLSKLSLADRWILSRLEQVSSAVENQLGDFGLSQASSELYHFVWNDFCDWYIELSKPILASVEKSKKEATQKVIFFVLERILRLLHPFMPFISEEIWQKLKAKACDQNLWPLTLSLASWPHEKAKRFENPEAQKALDILQRAVKGIRDLRLRLQLPPTQKLSAVIASDQSEILSVLKDHEGQIKILARLEGFDLKPSFEKTKAFVANAFSDFEVFIRIEGLVDPVKERGRLEHKIAEARSRIDLIQRKLADPDFTAKAPESLVQKEREKLVDAQRVLKSHEAHLELFQ
ncbi:MAG: valine--tRNA ligase [Candidatus Omnitrophica bacterium]|nr:valine--tRNA ligase [Candidatus Omnitrophota bacterium]